MNYQVKMSTILCSHSYCYNSCHPVWICNTSQQAIPQCNNSAFVASDRNSPESLTHAFIGDTTLVQESLQKFFFKKNQDAKRPQFLKNIGLRLTKFVINPHKIHIFKQFPAQHTTKINIKEERRQYLPAKGKWTIVQQKYLILFGYILHM